MVFIIYNFKIMLTVFEIFEGLKINSDELLAIQTGIFQDLNNYVKENGHQILVKQRKLSNNFIELQEMNFNFVYFTLIEPVQINVLHDHREQFYDLFFLIQCKCDLNKVTSGFLEQREIIFHVVGIQGKFEVLTNRQYETFKNDLTMFFIKVLVFDKSFYRVIELFLCFSVNLQFFTSQYSK